MIKAPYHVLEFVPGEDDTYIFRPFHPTPADIRIEDPFLLDEIEDWLREYTPGYRKIAAARRMDVKNIHMFVRFQSEADATLFKLTHL